MTIETSATYRESPFDLDIVYPLWHAFYPSAPPAALTSR
jgi:hypothetical protein